MEVGSEGWVKSTLIRNPNNSYSMVGSLDLYQSCGQDQDPPSGSLSELLQGTRIFAILTLIITWGQGANMTRLFFIRLKKLTAGRKSFFLALTKIQN